MEALDALTEARFAARTYRLLRVLARESATPERASQLRRSTRETSSARSEGRSPPAALSSSLTRPVSSRRIQSKRRVCTFELSLRTSWLTSARRDASFHHSSHRRSCSQGRLPMPGIPPAFLAWYRSTYPTLQFNPEWLEACVEYLQVGRLAPAPVGPHAALAELTAHFTPHRSLMRPLPQPPV